MTSTLADLDMHLLAFPDALPPHGVHAARKALARLALAAGQPAAAVPVGDVVANHAALKDDLGKCWYDEHAALERLLELPRLPADLIARIRIGTATMADARQLVQMQDWGDERGRIGAAIDRLAAKLFERQAARLDGLRATEAVMEPILAGFTHLDFVLQPAAWATMKSRIRRAVRLVDVHARTRLSASLLSGGWAALVAAARADGKLAGSLAKLWPLLVYCTRHGIEPDAVCDAIIRALQDDLAARHRSDAHAVAQSVVYAWERLQRHIPDWPRTKLARLYRGTRNTRDGELAFADLPDSLREEWEQFCRRHGRDDNRGIATGESLADFVIDEFDALLGNGTEVTGAYSAASLRNLRTAVIDLANAAHELGRSMASLRNLCHPDIVRGAMRRLAKRQAARSSVNGRTFTTADTRNGTMVQLAIRALSLACRVGADGADLAAIEVLRDKVDPRLRAIDSAGRRHYHDKQIGPRHAERLRAFTDPVVLHAWFELPYTLLHEMERVARAGGPRTLEQCGDAIVAVVYAITLCCPARRNNLACLTIAGPHPGIWLPPTGKGAGRLHVDWSQVKNRTTLHAELDAFAVKVIGLWLRAFRPAFARMVGAAADNPYLFPAKGNGHRAPELLNKAFVDRNRRAGFVLNLHCQRHLCAKVILDQDPTKMELVRQLLGHRNIRTTERYYADVSAILVQREFHRLLEAHRQSIYGELPRGQF